MRCDLFIFTPELRTARAAEVHDYIRRSISHPSREAPQDPSQTPASLNTCRLLAALAQQRESDEKQRAHWQRVSIGDADSPKYCPHPQRCSILAIKQRCSDGKPTMCKNPLRCLHVGIRSGSTTATACDVNGASTEPSCGRFGGEQNLIEKTSLLSTSGEFGDAVAARSVGGRRGGGSAAGMAAECVERPSALQLSTEVSLAALPRRATSRAAVQTVCEWRIKP